MSFVALTLGLLLALLVALLAIPLTIAFSIHRIEETRGLVRFRWLFGLVRFQVRIPQPARPRRQSASPGKKRAQSPRKKSKAGRLFSLIKQRTFRRRIYRFIRDLLRATHPRDLLLRMRIGLGDPADTGCLWAIVGPVAGLAQDVRWAELRIEPEFIDPVFEVESRGRFRLVPIQFIALAAAFLLSPAMLQALWRLRREA